MVRLTDKVKNFKVDSKKIKKVIAKSIGVAIITGYLTSCPGCEVPEKYSFNENYIKHTLYKKNMFQNYFH